MALQPAAGARDLNPRQVDANRQLSEKLAGVFRMWGYDEVSPPRVERLDTLMAGGAIASSDIVRLVADEPLGLRPEMTASIARAACTRLATRPRPLRLWASGTVFQSRAADEGGHCIEENLQTGVELFGVEPIEAEMELLSLLMASVQTLGLVQAHRPRLLVGHTGLMDLLLSLVPDHLSEAVRTALIQFDRLALVELGLSDDLRTTLLNLLSCRGTPQQVLSELRQIFGTTDLFDDLERLCKQLDAFAVEQDIAIQLDPTFQPHFELYTGLVFQLVCEGSAAPVVIARGGRYDDLVSRCGAPAQLAFGAGFSFAIDPIRELLSGEGTVSPLPTVLVAFSPSSKLEDGLARQRHWHQQGRSAVLELHPCSTRAEAETTARNQNLQLDWLDS